MNLSAYIYNAFSIFRRPVLPEPFFIVSIGFMSDILSHLCSLYSCVIKVIYMFPITLCIWPWKYIFTEMEQYCLNKKEVLMFKSSLIVSYTFTETDILHEVAN